MKNISLYKLVDEVILTTSKQFHHITRNPAIQEEASFRIQEKGYGQTLKGQSQKTEMVNLKEYLSLVPDEELDRWGLYNQPLFYTSFEDDEPFPSTYDGWNLLIDNEENIIVTAVEKNDADGLVYHITLVGTPYLFSYSVRYNKFWRVGYFNKNKIVPITPSKPNKDLLWVIARSWDEEQGKWTTTNPFRYSDGSLRDI